jgi:hypothetical protein
MDKFEFMVDFLINGKQNAFDNILLEDDECENASSAFVESILLNGYEVTDRRVYKTTLKKVTERINA